MNKKKADQQASHENTCVENTSGTAQRARLLERLQAGPIDTFTASLATRLARYNAHMAIARTLESAGGAQ